MDEVSAIAGRLQWRKGGEVYGLELLGHRSFSGVIADERRRFTDQVPMLQDVVDGLLDLSPLAVRFVDREAQRLAEKRRAVPREFCYTCRKLVSCENFWNSQARKDQCRFFFFFFLPLAIIFVPRGGVQFQGGTQVLFRKGCRMSIPAIRNLQSGTWLIQISLDIAAKLLTNTPKSLNLRHPRGQSMVVRKG